jgi:DNA repair protein RadC
MAITDWPKLERPREKLLHFGATALSQAELLAVFLQKGTKGKTAVDLARELLTEFKTLSALLNAPESHLATISGIGKVKFCMLQAALELSKRCLQEDLQLRVNLSNVTETKKFLIAKLAGQRQEVFACLFLNSKNQLIEYKELFFGTINCAPVYPRIVVQKALEFNASAVILAHNHPSGDPSPSNSDVQLTHHLRTVLRYIDIEVLDHIIIGGNNCISLIERGLI